LDDIFVFSKSIEEHQTHLELVLNKLHVGFSTGNPTGIQNSSHTPTHAGRYPVYTGLNLMGSAGTRRVRVHTRVIYQKSVIEAVTVKNISSNYSPTYLTPSECQLHLIVRQPQHLHP
jgi:hypothetical protein